MITKLKIITSILMFSTVAQSCEQIEKDIKINQTSNGNPAITIKKQDLERSDVGSYNIGFRELHELGITGKEIGIVIFEPDPIQISLFHPAFKGKKMRLVDVSRDSCSENFEDQSQIRYTSKVVEEFRMDFWSPKDHVQQIASILIGTPSEINNFLGGVAPNTNLTLISFSHINCSLRDCFHPEPIYNTGMAIYSFEEFGNKFNDLLLEEGIEKSQKIDDSILHALEVAFRSKARIIEGSFNLQSPCDYKKEFYLSEDYLNYLTDNLVENDQIMIFAAGNTRENITESIAKAKNCFTIFNTSPNYSYLSKEYDHYSEGAKFSRQNYFIQYATHPQLKDRFLIVTNIEKSDENTRSSMDIAFSNGAQGRVDLDYTSCYPGANKDLQEITVSAFGSEIQVATGKWGMFENKSGTSLAVPMVAGLLSLIDEYYQKNDKKLTGPQLIQVLKDSCLLPDKEKAEYYGKGIIDPLGFLTFIK